MASATTTNNNTKAVTRLSVLAWNPDGFILQVAWRFLPKGKPALCHNNRNTFFVVISEKLAVYSVLITIFIEFLLSGFGGEENKVSIQLFVILCKGVWACICWKLVKFYLYKTNYVRNCFESIFYPPLKSKWENLNFT